MQNGLILATFRTQSNKTQKEMANILHVSYSTYKLYEAGLIAMSLEELNTLSNYFNISLDYLLNLSHNPLVNTFRRSIDYRYLKFCLKFLRKKYRISQKNLAQEFHVSLYSICKYENKPETINLCYLYLFAKKFQISIDYLCGKSLKKEVL